MVQRRPFHGVPPRGQGQRHFNLNIGNLKEFFARASLSPSRAHVTCARVLNVILNYAFWSLYTVYILHMFKEEKTFYRRFS